MAYKNYSKILNDSIKSPQNITIDLASRFAAAFGLNAASKVVSKVFGEKMAGKIKGFEYYPSTNTNVEYVKLITPQKDSLEFSAVLDSARGNVFAPPLMMTFSQEKSLIETEVNDDDPIVIERWGTKPWNIEMKGLLIDLDNRIYPTEEIKKLKKVWSYNGVIAVEGIQFQEKGIDSIYFKSIDFSPIEGFQDTMQVSISASSIKSVNFILGKGKIITDELNQEPDPVDKSEEYGY
ncbi:DUF6046 domain-containing protein [Empedobacter tilapiae]|uniref:DUF6046 domain-containing protein n=1 Tax=Empedobacter tilapiae TaxID=2491114 RepID=A0A4Z1BPH5_9FLAO|nr:DUF6046 domain-containing protein [Empedobacter tilapiae]TGN26749.1 hypothetical protein E4J94_09900 [Empedobacter tilapiae]